MLKLRRNKNTQSLSIKGFTLLEALVAISILMVAVVTPITIAQKGLTSAVYTKSQMVASYLAQDAIEFIKNKKDVNVIAARTDDGVGWLDGLDQCLNSNWCRVDTINPPNGGTIYAGVTTPLSVDNSSYLYDYAAGGTPTDFVRKVNILKNPYGTNADEALITVQVSWGGTGNVITVKDLIYDTYRVDPI